MALIDLTGQQFGRLTVLERIDTYRAPKGYNAPIWLCVCECGNRTEVRGAHLRRGATVSCGCLRRNRGGKRPAGQAGVGLLYLAAHRRVDAAKGKASEHACVDCGGPALDWSYDGQDPNEEVELTLDLETVQVRRFSADPNHYSPRCRTCHAAYDAPTARTAD